MMNAGNGQHRPPVPAEAERNAAMWSYLKVVLVDQDLTAECDLATGQRLAGMILGQHVRVLADARGLTFDQALAEGLQWITDQAALSGSLAASDTTEGDI